MSLKNLYNSFYFLEQGKNFFYCSNYFEELNDKKFKERFCLEKFVVKYNINNIQGRIRSRTERVWFPIYTMRDECEHIEQHSVIKFLVKKNKTNTEIMKEQTSVYGTHALKSTAVKKWVGCFWSGRELLGNDTQAGWPATACNVHNVEKVKREIKDRQKTIRDVADSKYRHFVYEHA